MGFEPMNRGFADLYNRPLCQGTIDHSDLDYIKSPRKIKTKQRF
nr:MAG TPA: hypothetical protein [Caudoviricetes sp.]